MLWKSDDEGNKIWKKEGKTNIPGGCNLGVFWGGGGEDESLGHWNSTSYLGQNKTEQKTP